MKKFLSILFAIVVLLSNTNILCFAKDENYDIVVSVADVILYDKNSIVPDAFFPGGTTITVTFIGVERFSSCSLNIDYNTELLEYESSSRTPIRTVISGCSKTETGVRFFSKLGDMAIQGESYSDSVMALLKVNGVGKHNIKITADVKDLQGNAVDVKIKFSEPYEKIADASEIDFVEVEEKYMKNLYAFFDKEMLVSDVLELVRNKTAVIKNAEGKVLSDDDKVSTNARIVTLYEGFEGDAVSICVKYDVNCDGELTAADARLTLRYSAKLESFDGLMFDAADVDGKSGVTAADARLILRISAGLE